MSETSSQHLKRKRRIGLFVLLSAASVFALGALNLAERTGDGSVRLDSVNLGDVEISYRLPPYSTQGSLSGNYLAAVHAINTGDTKGASIYLSAVLRDDPENQILQAELFQVELKEGDMDAAVALLRQYPKLADSSILGQMLLAADEVRVGNFDKAREIIEKTPVVGLSNLTMPVIENWLALGAKKPEKPLDATEAVKKGGNFSPIVYYHFALMNDVAGFPAQAEEYYAKATEQLADMPYRVAESIASFYLRQGNEAKAEAIFSSYLKDHPSTTFTEYVAMDALKEGKNTPPTVSNAAEGLAEFYLNIASILYSEQVLEDAQSFLQLALHIRADYPPAQLMLGNVLEQMGQGERADKVYGSINRESPLYIAAQIRMAYNSEKQGKAENAIQKLDSLKDKTSNDYNIYLAKADIYRNTKQFTESAENYTLALKELDEVKRHHWPVLYMRGIAYERSKQWEKAEQDFLKALEFEPNQPDILNYLGYSWLEKGVNLGKARDMIERALQQRPMDAHIIDSMGWAYFKLGQYDKAVRHLERAVELMPEDPTVNEHLGDVYWKVGRTIEARFQWKRALNLKPEPDLIPIIERKLAEGLNESVQKQALESAENKESASAPQ
jgi:tetratricopeptide (TPR) repeat protein